MHSTCISSVKTKQLSLIDLDNLRPFEGQNNEIDLLEEN